MRPSSSQQPEPTSAGDDSATGVSRALADTMADQAQRQKRLGHVQEFLTSPAFIDMRDQPILVSDDVEAIGERRRDLNYRIHVLESVLALLIEELDMLDRVQGKQDPVSPKNSAQV